MQGCLPGSARQATSTSRIHHSSMKMKQTKSAKKVKPKAFATAPASTTGESTAANANAGKEPAPPIEPANHQQGSVAQEPPGPELALVIADTGVMAADERDSAKPDAEPLSAQEHEDKHRCEVVIEENEKGFLEYMAAMHEICTKRLYRDEYPTFEQYCRKRWNITRARGYQLVNAYKTVQQMSTAVDIQGALTSGNQVLELAKVPEKERLAVLKAAKKKAADGKMTSRHIREAARELGAGSVVQKKPSKQIHAPATEPAKSITANIMTPAEVFPNAKILTLAELSKAAETLQDIFLDPARRNEAEELLLKLKEQLRLYAEWAAQTLGEGPVKEPEAAQGQ
jgi:hypothetical protein